MTDVGQMINDFGEDVTIRRYRDGGQYRGGQFVDVGFDEFKIRVSVQPETGLQMTDEGLLRRVQGQIKIYSVGELKTTDAAAKIKADEVLYKGEFYEVQSVERWTQLQLEHYKTIARRRSQGAAA